MKHGYLKTQLQPAEQSSGTTVAGPHDLFGSAPPNRKPCILCVDDEIEGARTRAEILMEEGYTVALYHSPVAALDCDLSLFDLAILDFQMPELNGRELLLRMRAFGARFPAVLLTGSVNELSHEQSILFTLCMDKARSVQHLLDAIARLLSPSQVPDFSTRHFTHSQAVGLFKRATHDQKHK